MDRIVTRLIILGLAQTALSSVASAQPADRPTVAAVIRGMQCKQSSSAPGQFDCEYRVSRDLEFVIAGVGGADAASTVLQSGGYDGQYYLSVGTGHGCVIVKPGTATQQSAVRAGRVADMAFVSPRNGKVYATWQECGRAT